MLTVRCQSYRYSRDRYSRHDSRTGPCLRTRVPYAHLQTDAHAHPFAY